MKADFRKTSKSWKKEKIMIAGSPEQCWKKFIAFNETLTFIENNVCFVVSDDMPEFSRKPVVSFLYKVET